MRYIFTLSIFCLLFQPLQANEPKTDNSTANQPGYIVHLLNYLGNDYSNAVSGGKVINAEEYEEMEEFAESIHKNVSLLNSSDSLLSIATEIKKRVEERADALVIKNLCAGIKNEIVKKYQLKAFPAKYPSLTKGAVIYQSVCAKCHGDKGFGDGVEGKDLEPQPRNFHDNERMQGISAYGAFNTIKYGIEGTGMTANPKLSEEETWDVAFYILSLRHKKVENPPKTSLSLEKIATKSDAEIQLEFPAENIAAIRTAELHELNKNSGFAIGLQYLEQARNACLEGDLVNTDKMVTMAYLQGIEPNEKLIKELEPGKVTELEKIISVIRSDIKTNNKSGVIKNIKLLEKELKELNIRLSKTEIKPLVTLFLTASVLLREGIEALLIIIIFMNVLIASNFKSGKKYVHLGWIAALASGLALWLGIGELIQQSKLSMEIMEGVITIIAVGMMMYVGFWLHKKSSVEHWQTFITNKINSEKKLSSEWGIFSLTFLVVFREIFESILFVYGIDLQSNGENRLYIVAGCVAAFAVVVLLYFLATSFSRKIPFTKLISYSLIMLAVLSLMMIGKAVHSFQEAALVSQTFITFPKIEILGIYPTIETTAAQLMLLIGFAVIFFKMKKN